MATHAFGEIDNGHWFAVTVQPSSQAGKFNLINPDGTVVSVQPDGTVDDRPPQTDGPYERAAIDGNVALFWPDETTADVFAFGIKKL